MNIRKLWNKYSLGIICFIALSLGIIFKEIPISALFLFIGCYWLTKLILDKLYK